jgi:CheY-like chemotaxis protein
MSATDKKLKILIVDDVPGNIKILADILRNDYQIIMATSGQRALDIISSQDIALVLLDVEMPEMDGYEVCKKLKSDKETADIPVIFVTANTDKKKMVKGIVAGAIYYLTKPVDKDELRGLVMNVLSVSNYFSP